MARRRRDSLDRMFPELAVFDSVDERKAVYADACREHWNQRGWRTLGVVIGITALCFVWSYVVGIILDDIPKGPRLAGLHTLLTLPLFGLTFGWFAPRFLRDTMRPFIRAEAAKYRPPVCTECNYNLTGLTEPRCPECGTVFTPKEKRDEPPADPPQK